MSQFGSDLSTATYPLLALRDGWPRLSARWARWSVSAQGTQTRHTKSVSSGSFCQSSVSRMPVCDGV